MMNNFYEIIKIVIHIKFLGRYKISKTYKYIIFQVYKIILTMKYIVYLY